MSKPASSSCNRLIFIKGPRADLLDTDETAIEKEASDNDVFLSILLIKFLVNTLLSITPNTDYGLFFDLILRYAIENKFKEETIER